MSEPKKHGGITASTIARIAGNILSGTPIRAITDENRAIMIREAVVWAKDIAIEAERVMQEPQS